MCATQRVLIEGHAHYLIYMERARSFESQARREARDDHFDDDKKEEKYGWRQQHVKPEFGRWSIVEAFPQPVHLAVMRRGGGRGCPLFHGQAQKKKHQADLVTHSQKQTNVSLESHHQRIAVFLVKPTFLSLIKSSLLITHLITHLSLTSVSSKTASLFRLSGYSCTFLCTSDGAAPRMALYT